MPERRYLLGVLVYNGRDVVPRCLDSAARLVSDHVDVVVFDDCSPSAGWSDEVAEMCAARRIGYYRSPRNLGIPRNMSLLMRTAVEQGYDVAGLVNSDVVLPANLVAAMNGVFDAHPAAGSITPWSNNVSAFSLPMSTASAEIAEQGFVDGLSEALAGQHSDAVVQIPTGVGYCMIIPTDVIRRVGVMDPIFGRGYCEEVDWCQRALLAGFEHVLSLGSYVYHEGSGTNRDEGLLAHGMTTVIEHELIIRDRYPDYVGRVDAFLAGSELSGLGAASLREAIVSMMAGSVYRLVVGDPRAVGVEAGRTITVSADGSTRDIVLSIGRLAATVEGPSGFQPDDLVARYGLPHHVTVCDPGAAGDLYASWARRVGIELVQRFAYPTRA